MLYTVVAVLGIAAVVVFNKTDAVDDGIDEVGRWVLVVLGLPGVTTLLAFLFQVHACIVSAQRPCMTGREQFELLVFPVEWRIVLLSVFPSSLGCIYACL